MKLLIDAHYYDGRTEEGVNTFIKGVYSVMPRLAPDIDFYFASVHGDKLAEIFGENPNIRYIRTRSRSRSARLLFEYPSIIRKYGFDAAHFQYMSPPLKRCRTIVTIHDLLFLDFPQYFSRSYRRSRKHLFRHTARNADVVTTVSEYSRRTIADHFSLNPDNIIVTPNAIDEEFFKADKESARRRIYAKGIRPFIMNVSRLEKRKNQFGLVKAFAELGLAARGYDLVLVNRNDVRIRELEQFIAELPYDTRQRIHRIEGMPHHDLIDWYAAASLFVYPSLAEGFGIPPLEAVATLTPSVCHDSTAMSEFSFMGDNLADLSDSENLKLLIEKNLSDPPSPERLQEMARKTREKYNWHDSARLILDHLR